MSDDYQEGGPAHVGAMMFRIRDLETRLREAEGITERTVEVNEHLKRDLVDAEAERDRLRELLRIAYRYLSAAREHDCTGPEDCWTCAVDEALAEDGDS